MFVAKRYGRGFAVTSPREVTERVHSFNKGSRGEEENKEEEDAWVRIRTYDLKDFFTRVNRLTFMNDLKNLRERIREENRRFKYF